MRVTFTRIALSDDIIFISPSLKRGELLHAQCGDKEWSILGCPVCARAIRLDEPALKGERMISCAARLCPAEFVIIDWEIVAWQQI